METENQNEVLSPKAKELLAWLQDHPDADPEAIQEVQRRLRETRLNDHLNSIKTVNK